MNNRISYNSKVQKELDSETTALFYPLIDRYDKSLYEEITKQVIKSSTRSPYTVSWGNNINQYADYLSNIYVTSVFNGSLTHILRVIDRLKDIAFNLCKEYSDWHFRVLLLKLSLSKGSKKEVKGFVDLFNDVFGKMNASDSLMIFKFCNNVPISYQRDIAKLQAFKYLGYFFSDEDYENISKEIIALIENWVTAENRIIRLEDYIFETLKGNSYRIDKSIIIKVCLDILEKDLYRFYDNALKLIEIVGLEDIENILVNRAIKEINKILINETTRNNCNNLGRVIIYLRKFRRTDTNQLHQNVLDYMPEFYESTYKLETMVDSQKDSEEHISKYILQIKNRNQSQGKDGKYFEYSTNPFNTIKNIIDINKIDIDEILLRSILVASKETLFCPKQLLTDKVEAIQLIIFMKLNSKVATYDFTKLICHIESNKEGVLDGFSGMFFKQTSTTIQFNYMMMKLVCDNLNFGELLELLSTYSELEESEKIEALKALVSVFENDFCHEIEGNALFMILQFVLGLSHDSNHDVRYYAANALMLMITPATKGPIFNQLSKMIDYDSVYIKNLIINQAESLMNFDVDMLNFIMQKASIDNHYLIKNRGCDFIVKHKDQV